MLELIAQPVPTVQVALSTPSLAKSELSIPWPAPPRKTPARIAQLVNIVMKKDLPMKKALVLKATFVYWDLQVKRQQ